MRIKPLKLLGNFAKAALSAALIFFLAVNTPDLHERLLLAHRGSAVVRITNAKGTSGGTGFHVKAPSGNTYILTNAHVCALGRETGKVWVARDDWSRKIERQIIEVSQETDLCVVEPLPGISPISVSSSEAYNQEFVYVMGHPRLIPLTLSGGRIISWVPEIEVLSGIILNDEDRKACSAPKNRIKDFDTFFGKMTFCLVVIPAYMSNVVIYPGNSGSPVVDKWGRLVAVVFAGDSSTNYGVFVTLADIKGFLKYY